jgi:hypothetical protein
LIPGHVCYRAPTPSRGGRSASRIRGSSGGSWTATWRGSTRGAGGTGGRPKSERSPATWPARSTRPPPPRPHRSTIEAGCPSPSRSCTGSTWTAKRERLRRLDACRPRSVDQLAWRTGRPERNGSINFESADTPPTRQVVCAPLWFRCTTFDQRFVACKQTKLVCGITLRSTGRVA